MLSERIKEQEYTFCVLPAFSVPKQPKWIILFSNVYVSAKTTKNLKNWEITIIISQVTSR